MLNLTAFAFKNLKRKPVRTGILIAAIALLVSSLVFSLSFVLRVNQSIRTTTERLGADVIVVPTGSRGAAEEVLLENQIKSFYMDRSIMEKVRSISGVVALTDQTYLVTLSALCCSVPEAMLVAFDQDSDFIVKPWLKETVSRRLEPGEAIVGAESSYNINLGLVPVNSMLFGNPFTMLGTLDKTGTGLDNAIFVGRENLENIVKNGKANIKPGQISVIFIKVGRGVDPKKVANEIESSIIEVDTMTRKDIGKSIIATLRDVSRIFTLTMLLASLLSVFLVWSVFSAIANERSKEVGIMRALGARESHIVRLFVFEVLAIAFSGGLLGALFGTAFTMVLGNSFTILRNLANDLDAVMRLSIATAGFGIGSVICLAGALAPIQRLKKLEPLVAIKEE